MHTVTLFGGDGGTGKSLLSLQLAIAIAAGGMWLNLPVRKGSALYMGAEDDMDEMHRRIHGIVQTEGLSFSDLQGLTIRSLAGENALLAVEESKFLGTTPLYEALSNRAKADDVSVVFPSWSAKSWRNVLG